MVQNSYPRRLKQEKKFKFKSPSSKKVKVSNRGGHDKAYFCLARRE